MVGGSGVGWLWPWGRSARALAGEGTCPACSSPVPGWPPCSPLPSCLPSAIKGWFSPYHRKRQFGNPRNMESFGSKVLKYVVLGAWSPQGCLHRAGRGPGLGSGVLHRRELDHPALPLPGSMRTGRALSVTCTPTWRGSTSLTQWRSGWRRMSTPTWTSCGTWCGTTGPSSASMPDPK